MGTRVSFLISFVVIALGLAAPASAQATRSDVPPAVGSANGPTGGSLPYTTDYFFYKAGRCR